MTAIILNEDQQKAKTEIRAAYRHGGQFLLTGFAGTGKTTTVNDLTREFLIEKKTVAMTAPTHKACAVMRRKLEKEGLLDVPCLTIWSLLSLRPKPYGDRQIYERTPGAPAVTVDVVFIDECSMVGEDLYRHIRRYLPNAFIIYIGDPAQLPPVGEVESQTFETRPVVHLTKIVRQAEGNPIIEAATAIRQTQGGSAKWDWCRQNMADGIGIYMPGDALSRWMQKAFTSPEFEADPDTFRYLAWTNNRVREVNNRIRRWRYGENLSTPFVVGERAMFRGPLIIDKTVVFSTNQEAVVQKIAPGTFSYDIPETLKVKGWTATLPSWEVTLQGEDGAPTAVHAPRHHRDFQRVVDRLHDEAADASFRWKNLHDFKASMALLQSIYAMTSHTAQGSTFGTVFVDVPDIRNREDANLLEMQKLLYVAVTRASHRVILVGQPSL